MFQINKCLRQVNSDLEELFPRIRQGYVCYICFMEETRGLIDNEPPKFKNDALAAFKNYKALCEK